MKISRVETLLLRKKLSSSMRISRGGFSVRTHALVRVVTDEGMEGLGEGVGDAVLVKAIIDASLAQKVIGTDPTNITALRKTLIDASVYYEREGSALCAASAIEMACWDICGKALGKPVWALLGGRCREYLDAYASDVYWQDDPKFMATSARRITDQGFRWVKAHIGCESPERDSARVKALRESIGCDVGLMIDLNAGYDNREALAALRLWEEFDLTWLEEPVNPHAIEAMADLRRRSVIPIAAGENEFQVYGFKRLLDAGAVDVIMPDIGRCGGIQETRDICALARAYGIVVSPHNFSSGVLLAATMHLMAATPNATLLEFDSSDNAVYEELLAEPLQIKDGAVRVPDGPGLGVALKKETVEKYAVG